MSRLPTSRINSANYEEVYDYYESLKIHKKIPKIADFLSSLIIHPQVEIPDSTKEYFKQRKESGKPIVLVANHVQFHDHNVVSAAVHRIPDLHDIIVGNTYIYGKAPYFQTPIRRWRYEATNVVPVFRMKDVIKETGIADPKMEVGKPAVRLINMSVARTEQGQNAFLFPTGERTQGPWDIVPPIEAGIGHIAHKSWRKGIDVGIITSGIAYDQASRFNWLNPVVQFGEPILPDKDMSHLDITALVQKDMQNCVDLAYGALRQREPRLLKVA